MQKDTSNVKSSGNHRHSCNCESKVIAYLL